MMIINIIHLALCIFYILTGVTTKNASISRRSQESDHIIEDHYSAKGENNLDGEQSSNELSPSSGSCWLSMNAQKHFQYMDDLDNRYSKVRNEYQDELGGDFDTKMLETLLNTRGVALRDIHKAGGNPNLIPAGLNLGGYCMMKMTDSVLFFHRMKLRNNTNFRVNYLHNDLVNMVRTVHISLNDLHLLGAYERSPTDKDPSVLFYAPTYGQVEFLLKNVNYKMEGRLRLIKDRLIIELVISEIIIEDILMMYYNNGVPESPVRLQKQNIEDFIDRLKTDLDLWLKDYFNDYNMLFFGLRDTPNDEFQQAEKQKSIALNEYSDYAISVIKHKIDQIGAQSATIPHFTIFSTNNMQIKLRNGVIRGLDSLYRRSVATAKKEGGVRKVDLIIGFSNLKVEYKYEAILSTDVPPLTGLLILSADELTARMGLALVKNPESVDLEFDSLQQLKPESLTVEGPANRMISNFKHLLEHHIIAIMSSTLVHNVKMLRTLSRCEPYLIGESRSKAQPSAKEIDNDGMHDDSSQQDSHPQNDNDNKYINVDSNNSNDGLDDKPRSTDVDHQETIINDDKRNEEENEQLGPSGDDQNANHVDEYHIASHSNDENDHTRLKDSVRSRPGNMIEKNNNRELPKHVPKPFVKNGDIVKLKPSERITKARVKSQ